MRRRAAAIAPAVLVSAVLAVGGCISLAPSPAPSSSPRPTAQPAATASTPAPTPAATPAAAPSGTDLVDIPVAGIRLPVPRGWEKVHADALGDGDRRADIVARYPGADALLAAADAMGDRAVPAFVAFDSSVSGADIPLATNIAVLVAQPAVSGPLLDLVAGFIGDGLEDAFGATETARERVDTPLGEAVRLDYALEPRGGVDQAAVEYVIGAPAGTILVSVLGPADAIAELDPDALVGAMAPMP